MNESRFPDDEFREIALNLERFHEIFATLWKISQPIYSDIIPTAAVGFNKEGKCIDFFINKDFWNSINDYTQEFIICHEMLHVALLHGIRSQPYAMKYSADTINIALDLAVNHLLTNNFGFNRFQVDGWDKLCWADTVFKDLELPANKSFEFYINKIDSICKQVQVQIVDHSYLNQFDQNAIAKIRETANEVKKNLSKDELKALNDITGNPAQGRSDQESDNFSFYIGKQLKIKKIKKWETILTKYVANAEKDREVTQWARLNRRQTLLSSNLFLPSNMEVIDKDKYKYKIWLFLDYSGSCANLKDSFFSASNTFDPRKFEVKKFAHTTNVQEFKKDTVQIGGGGTSFSCIEDYIQNKLNKREIRSYPDAIFHFTDGDGNRVQPQHPERWYVFLSKSYWGGEYHKRCFTNPKINIYNLCDYVKENL